MAPLFSIEPKCFVVFIIHLSRLYYLFRLLITWFVIPKTFYVKNFANLGELVMKVLFSILSHLCIQAQILLGESIDKGIISFGNIVSVLES